MDHAAESILVVGHDANFQYLMRRYAGQSAYRVVFAALGEDVLELAQVHHPAAIILSLDLSGNSSWDLLRALKADNDTCPIPVVLCTWLEEDERALAEGASLCLHMPAMLYDFQMALARVGLNTQSTTSIV
jgi:CheY-like chemotaxis protein